MKTCTAFEFHKACEVLTSWTIRRAARMARDIGISYTPCADAPNTWEALQAEWSEARRQARGLRVWDGASDQTIYTMPEGNYAFRYLHDVVHASMGYDFSPAGETAAAAWHIKEVAAVFGRDSLETRLIEADTVGMLAYLETHGDFPVDQRAMVAELVGVAA